jgi:hypothetical protein
LSTASGAASVPSSHTYMDHGKGGGRLHSAAETRRMRCKQDRAARPRTRSEGPTLGLTVRPLLLFRAPSTLGGGTTAARCASAAERLGMLQEGGGQEAGRAAACSRAKPSASGFDPSQVQLINGTSEK